MHDAGRLANMEVELYSPVLPIIQELSEDNNACRAATITK